MFEKEAKKWVKDHTEIEYKASYGEFSQEPSAIKSFKAGAEFGYNKANEWHNLKTEKPPLRKEVLWCIDNQLWLGQLCESWIDFGEWDIDSVLFNDHEIAWKEIVLPELPKESE